MWINIAGFGQNSTKKTKYYMCYIPYLRKIKVYIHYRVTMAPNDGDVVSARGGGKG